jgi:putative hydrolase of the HAD superfamily
MTLLMGRECANRSKTMNPPSVIDAVRMKKAVIFDLFHTLVSLESTRGDSRPQLHEMLGVSREAFVEQLMLKSHDRIVGKEKDAFAIVAELAHAIDSAIPDAAIRRTSEHIVTMFSAALAGVPACVEGVLASLRNSGKRLGLVSNASAMEVSGWSGSPIAPCFDSVVFSCFVGCAKPDGRIYRICTDELCVAPEESIFVGDGESKELEGAKNLGMTTVMTTQFIGRLRADVIAERRRYADFVVGRLGDLIEDHQPASIP